MTRTWSMGRHTRYGASVWYSKHAAPRSAVGTAISSRTILSRRNAWHKNFGWRRSGVPIPTKQDMRSVGFGRKIPLARNGYAMADWVGAASIGWLSADLSVDSQRAVLTCREVIKTNAELVSIYLFRWLKRHCFLRGLYMTFIILPYTASYPSPSLESCMTTFQLKHADVELSTLQLAPFAFI